MWNSKKEKELELQEIINYGKVIAVYIGEANER